MKKRNTDKLKTKVKEVSFESVDGVLSSTTTTLFKGAVQFTKTSYSPELAFLYEKTPQSEGDSPPKLTLDWQSYSELDTEHGMFLVYEILFSEDFGNLTKRSIENMSTQIAQKVGDQSWKTIEKHLKGFGNETELQKVFLQATWAELFAEPLEELWLAAMAQHAFFVLEDDFAFGYLIAMLDQKLNNNESHLLRGKKNIESAKLGGQAKARMQLETTKNTLQEMARLIQDGQTIARSATLAHKNGFGSSETANKRLWTRHSKK